MTITASRPLRFVVLLVGGWIGTRTILLWSAVAPLPVLVEALALPTAAAAAVPLAAAAPTVAVAAGGRPVPRAVVATIRPAALLPAAPLPILSAGAPSIAPRAARAMVVIATGVAPDWPVFLPEPARETRVSRLSGSGWMIVRPGGTAVPFTPQLGGSQAGLRLTYALGEARRVALAMRLSSALAVRQREAAVGVDWQPGVLPIHLIVEQRIGLAGTRGGPSAGIVGGVGPTPLAGGFRLEAYGQAGGIARDGVEGFADGAARVLHPVGRIGPAALDLGIGAWGGAQRGASRLDAGPTAGLSLPIAGANLRMSLEWRQRLMGRARPDSGPALAIGTDF